MDRDENLNPIPGEEERPSVRRPALVMTIGIIVIAAVIVLLIIRFNILQTAQTAERVGGEVMLFVVEALEDARDISQIRTNPPIESGGAAILLVGHNYASGNVGAGPEAYEKGQLFYTSDSKEETVNVFGSEYYDGLKVAVRCEVDPGRKAPVQNPITGSTRYDATVRITVSVFSGIGSERQVWQGTVVRNLSRYTGTYSVDAGWGSADGKLLSLNIVK